MNSRQKLGLLVITFAVSLAAAVACGNAVETSPACTDGQLRSCNGAGSCGGTQRCSAAGQWSACECSGLDAGVDGTLTDAGSKEAEAGPDITPYLKNCPQVSGTSPMVEIAGDGGAFCIDTREVTATELDDARLKFFPLSNGAPPICQSQKIDPCAASDRTTGDLPANCVTWCDAAGFCKLMGKRLCGTEELGGACFAGGQDFPWGQDVDAAVAHCNRKSIHPASASVCRPPTPPQTFVVDVIGNYPEFASNPGQITQSVIEGAYVSGDPMCGVSPGSVTINAELAVSVRCCAGTQ